MEFYLPCSKRERQGRRRVSIPNGMEFYGTGILYLGTGVGFNSQRDGILPFRFGSLRRDRCGFNSQRDGILPDPPFDYDLIIDSFNSQRDGILRTRVWGTHKKWEFQFPTGWNSTKDEFEKPDSKACFNSQRDGILRHHCNERARHVWAFQFPTGWNSTQAAAMQAYDDGDSFNSQRDGILPWARIGDSDTYLFQFPTGWNSTFLT